MNIFFLSYYSGKVHRGVETFVHDLANHLSRNGLEVFVFQSGPKIADSVYTVISLNFPKKNFAAAALAKIGSQPGIIFSTGGRKESLICKFHSQIHRQKLVISGQSGLGMDDRLNLYLFPDIFVALTAHQARWARSVNPLARIEVIPNGVDIENFRPRTQVMRFNLPRPAILCAAALVPAKRQELLISAVSRTEASLLLVGTGPDRDKLMELGEKLLPGRFEINEFSHSEMPLVYPAADIFAFPTVPYESFGVAILEAMSCGLPVVATDDPIRKEIIGPAGLFADPRDTAAFAAALNAGLNRDWGDLPVIQAGKFSWDRVGSSYADLFKSL